MNYAVILTIIALLSLSQGTCYVHYNLKDSPSGCTFIYQSPNCSDYTFQTCTYYDLEYDYWLFGFAIQAIRKIYKQQSDLSKCGIPCCRQNITLATTFEGYKQCQIALLQQRIITKSFFAQLIDLIFLFLVIYLVGNFILYILANLSEAQIEPRQVQMRLL